MAKKRSQRIDLQIERKYFDQILSGEKKKEYRAISDYNIRLLCDCDIKDNLYYTRRDITHVRFVNGYKKDRAVMVVEVKGIFHEEFIDFIPDGMKRGDQALTIELGDIVESNVIK